jgi:hypothetical protein
MSFFKSFCAEYHAGVVTLVFCGLHLTECPTNVM